MKKDNKKAPKKANRRAQLVGLIRESKSTFAVYVVLRLIVIAIAVLQFFNGNYANAALCIFTLVLFLIPAFVESNFGVRVPSTLEIIVLLFIFAAEILGELGDFYVKFTFWDTMLHTINGFLCAAIGFSLVDMLNRNERFSIQLSPLYLAIVSFCFSMTVGVLWEFFEFSGDYFFGMDMQKDTVIHAINSVNLDPTLSNIVVHVRDISDVIIVHSDGTKEALGLGGYLDIGIIDTMKDLFVNFIGAVVFSCIGYFYVKHEGKGKVANRFIPTVEFPEEKTKQE